MIAVDEEEPPAGSAATRLRQQWESDGDVPDVQVFLDEAPARPLDETLALLLTDQQYRWRTSDPWEAERYLALCPAVAEQSQMVLDLIYREFVARTHLGETPDIESFLARFPHLGEKLQKQLEVAAWFDTLDLPATQPASLGEAAICPTVGARFDDYELQRELSRGGMGIIYQARHVKLNRPVALKAIQREIRFCLLDGRLKQVVGVSDVYQSVCSRFLLGLRAGDFSFSQPRDLINLLKTMARLRVAQLARFWNAQLRDVRRNDRLPRDVAQSLATVDRSPSDLVSDAELVELAMRRLPERDRTILEWRQAGAGWPEVARRLEVNSPEAVRKQHERSLAGVVREFLAAE